MVSKWTAGRIKALRKQYDLSQSEFLEFLPVSLDALRYWEQKRGPVPHLACWALDRVERELAEHFATAVVA